MRRPTDLLLMLLQSSLIATVASTLQVAFPFNAQVPEVARVGKPYSFTLSPSTFASAAANSISYTLQNQPAWLKIDSHNGTLYGTPTDNDIGAPQFIIAGTDGSSSVASMQATLVVSSNSGPQLIGDISTAFPNGWMRCGMTCMQFQPNSAFNIPVPSTVFSQPSTGISRYYYATLSDHSPLPGWMVFDTVNLALFGTTPAASALANQLNINIIVSDVAGFAGVVASFTFVVSSHTLIFDTLLQPVNVAAGAQVDIQDLRSHVYLDHVTISTRNFSSAILLNGPSWLTINAQNLTIQGTPPKESPSPLNVTVYAQDVFQDAAFLIIQLNFGQGPLFTGYIGTITAVAGEQFTYSFNQSQFLQSNDNISVDLGSAAQWLHFDSGALEISGTIPANVATQLIEANLIVNSIDNFIHDSQAFQIQIESTNHNTTTVSSSTAIPHKNAGTIAGIIIAVIAAIIIILLLLLYCRSRKHHDDDDGFRRNPSLFKRLISRPIPLRTADDPINIGERPVIDEERIVSQQPPQLELPNLNQRSPRKSWRFSALGFGFGGGGGDKTTRNQSTVSISHNSMASLTSTSLHHPLWRNDSLHTPYTMARYKSTSIYPQHTYLEYNSTPNSRSNSRKQQQQPITWADTVHELRRQKRYANKKAFPFHRPVSGLGHGQSFTTYDRSSFQYPQKTHSRDSSLLSTYSTAYSDTSTLPHLHYKPSMPTVPPAAHIAPSPLSQQHYRYSHKHHTLSRVPSASTSSASSNRPLKAIPVPSWTLAPPIPRKSSQRTSLASKASLAAATPLRISRPVSRRDPLGANFFASGGAAATGANGSTTSSGSRQVSYSDNNNNNNIVSGNSGSSSKDSNGKDASSAGTISIVVSNVDEGRPRHQRMSSAAGRRFAVEGLGLSTIDGSPGLAIDNNEEEISESGPLDRNSVVDHASKAVTGLGIIDSESPVSELSEDEEFDEDDPAWVEALAIGEEEVGAGGGEDIQETDEASRAISTIDRVTSKKSTVRPVSDGIYSSRKSGSNYYYSKYPAAHYSSRTSSIYSRNLDGSSIRLSGAPAPLRPYLSAAPPAPPPHAPPPPPPPPINRKQDQQLRRSGSPDKMTTAVPAILPPSAIGAKKRTKMTRKPKVAIIGGPNDGYGPIMERSRAAYRMPGGMWGKGEPPPSEIFASEAEQERGPLKTLGPNEMMTISGRKKKGKRRERERKPGRDVLAGAAMASTTRRESTLEQSLLPQSREQSAALSEGGAFL